MSRAFLSKRMRAILRDSEARSQLSAAMSRSTQGEPGTVEFRGTVYRVLIGPKHHALYRPGVK